MSPINRREGSSKQYTISIVGTYSVKSYFPKTKSLNLYLLVSLPASLPRTDYAKLPCLPCGKRPALAFFSPGLYQWIARSSKNQAGSCTPLSTVAFMNYVLPLADMWDIQQSGRRVKHQIIVQNSRGTHPSRTAPVVVVMSNETSNHNVAHSHMDEATIISHFAESASPSSPSRKPRIASAIVLPQEGCASPWYIMTRGTT